MTVEAYQEMNKKCAVQQDWPEDTFTYNLVDYIQAVARLKHSVLNLKIDPQVPVVSSDIKSGKIPASKVPVIDIRLTGNEWTNSNSVYFAWECKRLSAKGLNTIYDSLIPKYISEGVERFRNDIYSSGLEDGGMLGYVLAGKVADIVTAINQSMLDPHSKRNLSTTDQLVQATPIGTFSDIFHSNHVRTTKNPTSIRLHHLFLTFNFGTHP